MSDLFPQGTASTPGTPRIGAARARAEARKRRRRITALIAIPAIIAVLVPVGIATAGGAQELGRSLFSSFATPPAEDYEGPGELPVTVNIPAGATGSSIGRILFDHEVVASVAAFTAAFQANPDSAGIQPGITHLYTRMSAADAVALLALNERQISRITFPEGFRAKQVVDRIVAQTHISQAEFDAILCDPTDFDLPVPSDLGPVAICDPTLIGLPETANHALDGWLFPATYDINGDETAAEMLSRMVARTYQEFVNLEIDDPQRQQEIVSKASIIQWEAPRDNVSDDPYYYFRKVATVIQNRLDNGIPLGMDAIDQFGLGRDAPLVTSVLQDASLPYASRVHLGLPPTPIGNAGAAALAAAANPEAGPWLFFVTVNLCTGETHFVNTYPEHRVYQDQFRAWRNENLVDGRVQC